MDTRQIRGQKLIVENYVVISLGFNARRLSRVFRARRPGYVFFLVIIIPLLYRISLLQLMLNGA